MRIGAHCLSRTQHERHRTDMMAVRRRTSTSPKRSERARPKRVTSSNARVHLYCSSLLSPDTHERNLDTSDSRRSGGGSCELCSISSSSPTPQDGALSSTAHFHLSGQSPPPPTDAMEQKRATQDHPTPRKPAFPIILIHNPTIHRNPQ